MERVVVAEGDRVMTREEIVELADAVAASSGIASGIGTTGYGAQMSSRPTTATRRSSGRSPSSSRPRRGPVCRVADHPGRGGQRGRRARPDVRMIRLGSLAGYPFEGPRVLAGWTAPASPRSTPSSYKPEPDTKPDSTR